MRSAAKKASITASAVGILVALLMLTPIGGDTRSVEGPGGSSIEANYYWSLGTVFFGFFVGEVPQELNIVTIALGLAIATSVGVVVFQALKEPEGA
jgi:hypothetical protein